MRKHKDDALQTLVDKAKIAAEAIDAFCKKMVKSFPTLSRIAALILSIKGILGTLYSVSGLGATAYASTVTAIKHGTKQLKNMYVEMGDGTYLNPLRYMMLKLIDLLVSITRILVARKINGYLASEKKQKVEDYGVKGMKKGQHLKAKDNTNQAGGVQKKNAAAAQPSRAAKIAKILGGAALLGGGAYLAGKGLANLTRNRVGQSSTQSRPATSSSSSRPSNSKPSKSFSFKPSY